MGLVVSWSWDPAVRVAEPHSVDNTLARAWRVKASACVACLCRSSFDPDATRGGVGGCKLTPRKPRLLPRLLPRSRGGAESNGGPMHGPACMMALGLCRAQGFDMRPWTEDVFDSACFSFCV